MLYLAIKAGVLAVIIVAVSEIADRYPSLGAMNASLPLISIPAMIWLSFAAGYAPIAALRGTKAGPGPRVGFRL